MKAMLAFSAARFICWFVTFCGASWVAGHYMGVHPIAIMCVALAVNAHREMLET